MSREKVDIMTRLQMSDKYYTDDVIREELVYDAMDEWAKKFLEWVSENCEILLEDKITLYRYRDRNNEWDNYILDDIFTVFLEEMYK